MLELLRHGDTGQTGFRGRLDDALSPLGWVQMEAAVAGRYWQRVHSSPLQRCRRFAEGLASRLGVPFALEPELIEYDFGEWTGRTPAELHASGPIPNATRPPRPKPWPTSTLGCSPCCSVWPRSFRPSACWR